LDNPEIKSEIPEIKSEPPQPNGNAHIEPQSELNNKPDAPILAEIKSQTAEGYQKEISQADETAERLKQQISALRQSEELLRQQKRQYEQRSVQARQVNEVNQQINQVFHFWQQSGLSPDQEQILRANPVLMVQLTDAAARQAAEQGHQVGSAAYVETARQSFFAHLERLQEQAKQTQQSPEPAPAIDNQHRGEPTMQETPKFFTAPPAPPARQPASHYSAPVSRTVPSGGPRPDYELGRTTLTREEKEAAHQMGVSLESYAAGKLDLQRRKANGEVQ
jgi:hypothetical protein